MTTKYDGLTVKLTVIPSKPFHNINFDVKPNSAEHDGKTDYDSQHRSHVDTFEIRVAIMI
jgi:hypothetical protein